MSMSEFEEQRSSSFDEDRSSFSFLGEREFPDDFSDEEMAFALELDSFFSPDKEELPPYFVQTLLASEDERFQVLEQGFEKKTYARVSRQLSLRRRIFHTRSSPAQRLANMLPARRPFIMLVTIFLLILTLTVTSTGGAFTSGLTFLLSGAHSGAWFANDYPQALPSATVSHSRPAPALADIQPPSSQMDLWQAEQALHFSMYWPDTAALPANYKLSKRFLDDSEETQGWADGPVLELEFNYASPGLAPKGSGIIAIAEFKPLGKVMQAIQPNSAHVLEISPSGDNFAIYIDGQWQKIDDTSTPYWVYGQCSQLLYEHDGVIFWVVGDQRDGVNEKALLKVATSLSAINIAYSRHMNRLFNEVLQGNEALDAFVGDVVYLSSPDNTDSPTFKVIGAAPPPADPDVSHLLIGSTRVG